MNYLQMLKYKSHVLIVLNFPIRMIFINSGYSLYIVSTFNKIHLFHNQGILHSGKNYHDISTTDELILQPTLVAAGSP